MFTPSVVTVIRVKKRRSVQISNKTLWARQRDFLRREATRWFLLEVLAFGLLTALSAWSLAHTVAALRFL